MRGNGAPGTDARAIDASGMEGSAHMTMPAASARALRLAASALCLVLIAGCDDSGSSKTASTPDSKPAEATDSLTKAKEHAVEAAKEAGEAAKETGAKALDATKEAAVKAGEKAQELGGKAVDATKDAAKQAGEKIKDATK